MIIMMNDLPKDMLKLSTIQDMDNYTMEDCKKYKEAINKRVLDLKSSNIMKFLISCCDDENLTKEVSKHASRNKGLIERFDYFYITGSMMIFLVGKYEICICGNICNILIDHESVYNEGYHKMIPDEHKDIVEKCLDFSNNVMHSRSYIRQVIQDYYVYDYLLETDKINKIREPYY